MKTLTLRVTRQLVVGLIVLVAFSAIGCGSSGGGGPADDGAPNGGTVKGEPPGVYTVRGGRSRVVGTVAYRDLEGGFWAIVDTDDPSAAATAPNLAILVAGPSGNLTTDSFAGFEGEYVVAQGTMGDGASIYMAGPMLTVDSIEREVSP